MNVAFSPFFFFNDTATTEIYTLSLHDALPICGTEIQHFEVWQDKAGNAPPVPMDTGSLFPALPHAPEQTPNGIDGADRSEEHTSELQSQSNLVCRLLLEKKKRP